MANEINLDSTWGTDGVLSLPEPLKTVNTIMVDMDGFCFTPNGIRVNLSAVDREALLARGFGPERTS